MEEAHGDEIRQVRVKSQLQAIVEGVFDSCIIYCNGRWLTAFLMKGNWQELDNSVLGHVGDTAQGHIMLEDFLVGLTLKSRHALLSIEDIIYYLWSQGEDSCEKLWARTCKDVPSLEIPLPTKHVLLNGIGKEHHCSC